MQAGVGGFAHGIQAGNVGAGIVIGHHTTAGVMRSGHDWNALLGDVDAQFKATFVNGREMFFQFLCRFMADVQVHAIQAAFFHFKVDGARHYIPRCQFCPFVVLGHEACAIGQFQQTTFAAHCFGDQKAFGIGVVQAGGVELDEFHIGNSASCAPGHGNAVARGCVGVGGVVVHFARAAASQHNVRAGQREYALRLFIQNVSTQNTGLFLAQTVAGDQVDHHVVFKQLNVGVVARFGFQRGLYCIACGIGHVQDSPAAVPAFPGQVEPVGFGIAGAFFVFARKRHTLFHQPVDGFGCVFQNELHCITFAKAATRYQGVLHMLGHAVGRVAHSGNATLGPTACRVGNRAFANNGHFELVGQLQGGSQSCQTTANDGDIELFHFHGDALNV